MSHLEPTIIRLCKKIIVDKYGCWIFNGSKNDAGYGIISHNGKQIKAHRFSFEFFNFKIKDNLNVCHKCDIPNCVNPDHLFLGTQKENVLDMISKKRNHWSNQTHCKKGHPLFGNNLSKTKRQRVCKKCRNEANRKLYWEKKNGTTK